jgi:hypothetical protein
MKGRKIGEGRAVSKCEFSCPFPLDVEEGVTGHHLLELPLGATMR